MIISKLTFLDYNVRYIAVNDGVDTFKNIFNDWYARDISKKIRAVNKAKALANKLLSTHAPYVYKKSETDKSICVIDDEAAEVIRKIFRLCIEGNGPTRIARILTEEGIPTPTVYFRSKGLNPVNHNAKTNRWEWLRFPTFTFSFSKGISNFFLLSLLSYCIISFAYCIVLKKKQ